MKHRIAIAAVTTTAALAGTCAFLVPAASASPGAPKTHTLTFTAVEEAVHSYTRTVSSQQDRDVNKTGKVVGMARPGRSPPRTSTTPAPRPRSPSPTTPKKPARAAIGAGRRCGAASRHGPFKTKDLEFTDLEVLNGPWFHLSAQLVSTTCRNPLKHRSARS